MLGSVTIRQPCMNREFWCRVGRMVQDCRVPGSSFVQDATAPSGSCCAAEGALTGARPGAVRGHWHHGRARTVSNLVDKIQRLMPTAHRCDDLVGIGGPDERFGLPVGFGDEAVDGGLQLDDRGEHAAFQPAVGELGEEALDGIQPRGEVGVKWKVQRWCRSSQARTLGCLCVA